MLDFAGGIAVHNIAGMAALASVLFVGRHRVEDSKPYSIPLVALGTGLLWFGWYGFSAGSELAVDRFTALAFLNTDIAASFAAMTWLAVAWILERKPKFLGLFAGGTKFFLKELAAIGISSVYAFAFTCGMLWIINRVTVVRTTQSEEQAGLDEALHGEPAYESEVI